MQGYEDRPAIVADRTESLVTGLAARGIEEQVDTSGNGGKHLLDPVAGVVVEHFAAPKPRR